MARKRRISKKQTSNEVIGRLQESIKRLQHDADALLGRTRKQAANLITRDQQRALDRLFGQAQRLRADLERRAQRASKDVESRAERFLATLEKEASKRLAPLLKRLDLPSRQEIHILSRRVGQLERRVHGLRPASEQPVRPRQAPEAVVMEPPAE
jgi:polyhydroxyalkanoate synthesis regulator phasin